MKLKSLTMLVAGSFVLGGCTNELAINPRLAGASSYSLSIYATDRANINMYSEDDDSVATSSDEADILYGDENVDQATKTRKINNETYGKNVKANSSNDTNVITQELGKADNRATPIKLKIFQLTDKSLFLSSSYDDFTGKDYDESLGKTYVSNIDLIVAPNQFRFIEPEELNEKTHYIGVVALYNNYDKRKWKGIVQVKPKGSESYPLLIRVLDSKVEIHKDN